MSGKGKGKKVKCPRCGRLGYLYKKEIGYGGGLSWEYGDHYYYYYVYHPKGRPKWCYLGKDVSGLVLGEKE